jgi:AraC-like DNA-binding protein
MSTTYYTIPPTPELAPYVRAFWVFEHAVAPGSSYVYRSMADGCAEMVFHYKALWREVKEDDSSGALYPHSLLHAQSKSYKRFTTQESFGIFGVYLYPFAVPQLFGHSSTVVINLMISLQDVLGQAGKDLEEQMMLAAHNQQRAAILSMFLLKQLRKHQQEESTMQEAVKQVIHTKAFMPVAELSQYFNLSQRQFERKFKEFAGFSPKMYSRIIRFQSAMKHYGSSIRSLTDIAYECGYYDQSHFIHDFKEFSGYHPGQYFKGRPEGIEYREV